MAPVLSLTYSPVQIAGHNSPAFLMDPFRLHVSGYFNPVFFSAWTFFSQELNRNLDGFKYEASQLKNMSNEVNGSGKPCTLNAKKWTLVKTKSKTDSRGRVFVGIDYHDIEISAYVSEVDQDLEFCGDYIILPTYKEIRKSRIKKEIGEPVTVQKSGDLWLGAENKDKYVKIFVKVLA